MEAAYRKLMLDCSPAYSQLRQLPASHHAVLAPCEGSDQLVTWVLSTMYVRVESTHVPRILAGPARDNTRV
jgi:hypothetical protein